MANRTRKVQLKFWVTEEERAIIERKMEMLKTKNMTRNRFVLNRARGFESHHLRQKCLCIARCRGAFSFRTPSSPLRPFRHFSQLRPPSLVQHAQKNSIFLCKKP